MKFALFIGCNIPARVQQYEMSARTVLKKLQVELVDIDEFKCCGYPMRNTDFKAFILSSARNLALAEKQDLCIMTLCKCCFGSLKKAARVLTKDPNLKEEMNTYLKKEGLTYAGKGDVTHFLSVLHKDIGLDILKNSITQPLKEVNIATHYGCHALRPSEITQFDDPVAPVIFDELVNVTGAKSIDWMQKLECCGAPLLGINDELSMDLMAKKLLSGKNAGADYLCTACPWCQLQFDTVQPKIKFPDGDGYNLPSLIFSQLLGVAMGIESESLGLKMNRIDVSNIVRYVA